MNLDFNVFNIIMFAGIIQGFLFGIVVLTSKGFSDKVNRFLALTIITLSFNNLYYWFIDIGLEVHFKEITLFYLPWHLLFPITFYIYVNDYVGDKIGKYAVWILFSPFLISSITHISINTIYDLTNDIPFWIKVFYIGEEYLAFTIALLVGFLSYNKLKRVMKENSKIDVEWLKKLLRAGLILCVLWSAMYTVSIKFNIEGLKLYYPIWLGISIMFYWIGYRGLYQFKLAKDRKAISMLLQEVKKNIEPEEISPSKVKNQLFNSFLNLIENKHFYRKQNLTLDSTAKKLKTNRTHLSKIVNQVTGKRFDEIISEYRVNEAKKLLCAPDAGKYKVEAIGYEVGFAHVSTFYSTFKKYTGVSPAKFRKEHKHVEAH
ncbi:helix-turn-helix transcriptional regulator [Aquimarina sp. U1-2]|uniref:helix-turn-helix domain-containing protein n=1 Tax=Aquimarina sp. U1-2 TaxID=2823141 RepID=UPI001AECA30C|nr:response regulator transcription factor [Aquimarina sp. U1-2]MBP2832612.1 helix-turn-helix transcriptional regulator [Aquimarina sp. U1-2]